eukprot:Hpha_TRINITY_DN16503_c1_g1::TRINITY_DN16503_c1_g1_i1::g.132324::m.132324
MKLLDVGNLSSVNASLDRVECCGSVVTCRVDAYSCKKIQSDKRLAKHVQNRAQNSPISVPAEVTDPAFLPPPASLGGGGGESPAAESQGKWLGKEEAELATNLISTINMAFPDHDFSDVYPWQFRREEASEVRKTLSEKLREPMAFLQRTGNTLSIDSLWLEVQKVVEDFDSCEFFCFQPGTADSPLDGALWAHYYFIYNSGISKLVFVHLHASADDDTLSNPSPRAGGRGTPIRGRSRSSDGANSPLSMNSPARGAEDFQLSVDSVSEPPAAPISQPTRPPSPPRRRQRAADGAAPAAAAKKARKQAE